jgi:hypothetical protein
MSARHETKKAPWQAPEVLDSEPGLFSVYSWLNTTIVVWPHHATGSIVDRLAQVTRLEAREHKNGFSNFHLVKNGAGLPTPEARKGFVAMMHEHSTSLACVATVLLGTGFWVSALQSVATGMRMLSPRSFDHRTTNSIESTVAWVPKVHLERTGVEMDPDHLRAALEDAYSRTMALASTAPD